jgi:hypothetical protein
MWASVIGGTKRAVLQAGHSRVARKCASRIGSTNISSSGWSVPTSCDRWFSADAAPKPEPSEKIKKLCQAILELDVLEVNQLMQGAAVRFAVLARCNEYDSYLQ